MTSVNPIHIPQVRRLKSSPMSSEREPLLPGVMLTHDTKEHSRRDYDMVEENESKLMNRQPMSRRLIAFLCISLVVVSLHVLADIPLLSGPAHGKHAHSATIEERVDSILTNHPLIGEFMATPCPSQFLTLQMDIMILQSWSELCTITTSIRRILPSPSRRVECMLMSIFHV